MNEKEIKNVTANFFNLLRHLQNKFFRPLELFMKCEISPMQFRTMGIISEKQTITMTELANEVLISKQQLTPMIDKMIDSNIVERKNDKEDRRIIKISLTSHGVELLENHKNQLLKSLSKKFESLDLDDIEKLNTALDQINKIINKLE
jgi:MarR family transcriptional regulator, organic hydroperoxide resistance regulator